ncbi:hypothetical protein KBC97_03470 [Candidatus Gracilibacteria bacterium]|nr:hypothetical protein [Candidatus Gracilibacteria bacterium]
MMQADGTVRKKARFEDPTDPITGFTPLKKMRASAVRNSISQCLADGQYEQLEKILAQYKKDGFSMENFFFKEGDTLLNLVMIGIADARPLKFLAENAPLDILREKLLADNQHILNQFLLAECGFEKLKMINETHRKNRVEKIKCLLNLDSRAVYDFFSGSLKNPKLSETAIVRDIEEAIQEAKLKYELSYR